MSTIIQGDGTQPLPTGGGGALAPRFVAIASTTFTTPITVNTATPHGFFSGDTVEIEGADDPNIGNIVGPTGTNGGLWVITVTGASAYQLNNSVGTLAGGAHGFCVDHEVQPAFQIPSPGELASMRTMGPIVQGILNAIPWLYRLTGRRRTQMTYGGTPAASAIAANTILQNNTGTAGAAWGTATTPGFGNWVVIPNTAMSLASMSFSGPANPIVEPDDELDIQYVASVTHTVASHAAIALYVTDGTHTGILQDYGGAEFPGNGPADLTTFTNAAIWVFPISLRTIINGFQLAAKGITLPGPISIGLAMTSVSGSVSTVGAARITVVQRRIN